MTNFVTNPGSGGSTFASDTIAAVEYPLSKSAWGAAGAVNQTSAAAPMPVTILTAPTATTGAITTASTTVGPVTMGSFDGLTVAVSGTYAGVNFGFWGSNDNTIWYPLAASRVDTSVSETTTGVLTANTTRAWDVSIGEALYFRIVSTAWTSGSAAINIMPGMMAAEPIVSAMSQGLAASGSPLLGNPVLMAGSDATNARAVKTDTAGNLTCVIMDTAGTNKATVKAASTAAATADTALVVSMAGANSATKIGDGTNNATVKAASTAAVAADPTLVVAISPNLPAPTASFVNSAATTNATSVKNAAGTVYNITASNTGAAAAFVKFYNKASAPTVGTDVPVFTMAIPASGTVTIAPALVGIRFGTGIALAITNLAADSDTTAVTANQVKVATSYI